jgi:hypothetical protein
LLLAKAKLLSTARDGEGLLELEYLKMSPVPEHLGGDPVLAAATATEGSCLGLPIFFSPNALCGRICMVEHLFGFSFLYIYPACACREPMFRAAMFRAACPTEYIAVRAKQC